MPPSSSESTRNRQIVSVSPSNRHQVQRRLQELSIPAWCSADGHLRVEVNSCVAAVQVRSVLQQFQAPRSERVDWLERCWQAGVDEPSR